MASATYADVGTWGLSGTWLGGNRLPSSQVRLMLHAALHGALAHLPFRQQAASCGMLRKADPSTTQTPAIWHRGTSHEPETTNGVAAAPVATAAHMAHFLGQLFGALCTICCPVA